ncbi:MAG TPA: hypothetical protein VF132_00005, partial [Rudaea sp.]
NRSLLLLRSAVVFGEDNRGNVHQLIEQIRQGRFVMIGDGANRKSIAYVGNIAEYLADWCVSGPPGAHTYNFADKPDKSMSELVASIAAIGGFRPIPRVSIPRAAALALGFVCDAIAGVIGRPLLLSRVRVQKFCANTQLATDAIERSGYRPVCSLDDGLARTIAAIESAPRS